MSVHARLQLRNAVVAALNAVSSLTGKVSATRINPIQPAELPVLLVFVPEERITAETQVQPRLMARHALVNIDILAFATTGFDDALETLATAVEVALGATTSPFGALRVLNFELVQATKARVDGQSQDDVMMLRLEYAAHTQTFENDPTTVI